MKNCTNCGTQMTDDTQFCPNCGTPANFAAAPPAGDQPYYQDPAGGQQHQYQNPVGGQQPPYQNPYTQPSADEKDIQDNKMMAVLAYLGILVLVPIFAAKESKFARYHANQGLVLALAEVAFAIVYSILVGILTSILFATGAWALWSILSTLLGLLWLGFVVLAIIGIVNAVNGRMKPLPLIGKITILK